MTTETATYTKAITLDEVTVEEFWDLEDHWDRDRPIYRHELYARMTNPIIQEDGDYHKLCCRLIQHPNFHMLRARTGKQRWKELHRTADRDPHALAATLADIAATAEQDHIKRNYFNVELRERGNTAIIEFREEGNILVGYFARIHSGMEDHFTINPTRSQYHYTYANGIWSPE